MTTVLSYSFAPAGLAGYPGQANTVAMTAKMKTAIRAGFRLWELYADCLNVEVPHDGTAFAFSDTTPR